MLSTISDKADEIGALLLFAVPAHDTLARREPEYEAGKACGDLLVG